MIEIAQPSTPVEVKKAIAGAVDALEKAHGHGIVFRIGDRVGKPVPNIPTGIYEVDYNVLGVGGLPKGRIIEIYGPASSGKTTMALSVVASAQRAGAMCAYVDVENALDATWGATLGCNMNDVLVSQPDCAEQALEVVQTLVETGAFGVVVVDSVAALVTRAELNGDFGDSHMGLTARLMSQAMRKLNGAVSKSGVVLIFINQLRDKLGVQWGSPETTTGGRALAFYASVRLDVRRTGAAKAGETVVGNEVKVKAAKNKVAPPFREAKVNLLFDQGFDCDGSLVDAAIAAGVVTKKGAWFAYQGEQVAQGRTNTIAALKGAGFLPAILKATREKAEA